MVYIHTCQGNTHTHKIKVILKKRLRQAVHHRTFVPLLQSWSCSIGHKVWPQETCDIIGMSEMLLQVWFRNYLVESIVPVGCPAA